MVARQHERFLLDRVRGVRHSGREFYAHLKGVHDLLRDWGNPEHVCLAGLFHSIYGTNVFKHQSIDFKERPVLRGLIGKEAENLAYLFCVIDRPKVLLDSETMISRHFYDHHCHQTVQVSHQTRDELIEIEAANLVEQGAVSARIFDRLALCSISLPARLALERARP